MQPTTARQRIVLPVVEAAKLGAAAQHARHRKGHQAPQIQQPVFDGRATQHQAMFSTQRAGFETGRCPKTTAALRPRRSGPRKFWTLCRHEWGLVMTLTIQAHFVAGKRGRQLLRLGPKPPDSSSTPPSRLATLMALAIKYDEFLKRGDIRDYAALARTHSVDPGVITRVMNLRLLAPDIQQKILGLSAAPDGKIELHLKHVLPITRLNAWGPQPQKMLFCEAEREERLGGTPKAPNRSEVQQRENLTALVESGKSTCTNGFRRQFGVGVLKTGFSATWKKWGTSQNRIANLSPFSICNPIGRNPAKSRRSSELRSLCQQSKRPTKQPETRERNTPTLRDWVRANRVEYLPCPQENSDEDSLK